MHRNSTLFSVVLLLVAVLAGSCASGESVRGSGAEPQETERPATSDGDGSTGSHEGSDGGDSAASSDGDTEDDDRDAEGGTGGDQAEDQAEEQAEPTPSLEPLPMEVTLAHGCVQMGGAQTLTVETEPWTGVAYEAFYADGKSGAEPPNGEGYGGNDGALARQDGHAEFTWQISTEAPSGPVRVEVIGGKNEHELAEKTVEFRLAGTTDPCT